MIRSRRNAGIAAGVAVFILGVTACASGESGESDSAGGEPAVAASDDMASQEEAIYEVRNYHFDPARFDEYAEVARGEYLRYLREHLDIVGFWVDSGIPAEVRGAEQDELGSANITWVIRWASKAERDEKLPEVLGTPEWREIFAEVPGGGASYLRVESRFMESLY